MENKIYFLQNPFELVLTAESIEGDSLQDGELFAQTIYTCVSPGTELAAYTGMPPLRPGKQYPRLMGYCNVAKVINTGTGVSQIKDGDHVLTFQSHRKFFKCKATDVIAVLPADMDLRKAATVYLFHLGYMALLESNARAGMSIGIIGTGTLGYGTALLSKEFGFSTTVFSNQEYLRTELTDAGMRFSSRSDAEAQALYNSFDVIINTSNSWNDWFLALKLLAKKGVMVNLGFPGRGCEAPELNPLDSQFFYDKQLTFKAAGHVYEGDAEAHDLRFSLKRNIAFLLELIATGRLDPSRIISKEWSWDQLGFMYEFLLQKTERKFTGILNWQLQND